MSDNGGEQTEKGPGPSFKGKGGDEICRFMLPTLSSAAAVETSVFRNALTAIHVTSGPKYFAMDMYRLISCIFQQFGHDSAEGHVHTASSPIAAYTAASNRKTSVRCCQSTTMLKRDVGQAEGGWAGGRLAVAK